MYQEHLDYLKESSWTPAKDRDYFYVVNKEKCTTAMQIIALLVQVGDQEFEGFSLKPMGKDAVLTVRVSAIFADEYIELEKQIRQVLSDVEQIEMVPCDNVVILKFTLKDFYSIEEEIDI